MQYRVGQVIYTILSKKGQVYPMRIIEEITKKTLRGEEINYVVQAGASVESTILLSQIEGEVFTTPDEAKRVLIERATGQIEKIVDNAIAKSKEWYSAESVDDVEVHELSQPEPSHYSTVKLPDGSVARLKLSNDK